MTGLEIQEAAFRIVGEALDQGWELAKSNFPEEVKKSEEVIPAGGLGWDVCGHEDWLQLHLTQDGRLNVQRVSNRKEPLVWSVVPFSALPISDKLSVLYTVGAASETLST